VSPARRSPVTVTRRQVAAWRMRRQYLDPRTDVAAEEIVSRLCGVQAQVWSAAETAVALRQVTPDGDGVDRASAGLSLMKTWAMRGTLHLLPPAEAGAYLSVMETVAFWLKPSWQRVSGVNPRQLDELTDKVAEVLDVDGPLTRDQLVQEVVADPRFTGLEDRLRSGWGQVLKPLAWRGVLCHGPAQGNRITFAHPARQYPQWRERPDADEAAPRVVAAYLGAYGPATPEVFDRWLSVGSSSRPRLRGWFAALGDALTPVDVEGETAWLAAEHVDELAGSGPCTGLRLLGAFDQYVLGPGTGDGTLLPREHRSAVSRTAGWISPVVVLDGRIAGVWDVVDGELVVSPFAGAGPLPREDLEREAEHVARARGSSRLPLRETPAREGDVP